MQDNFRDDRRTQIIQTSISLFSEKGYHAATLDELAKRVGVTKAALYYYVRNKEEILREINKQNRIRMEKAIRLCDSNLSPREKLRKFIQYHVGFAAESAKEANILFEQTNSLPKRMREGITLKKKEVEWALQRILEDGVNQGYFAIKDRRMSSFAILGLCNWTYHWYKPDGELNPEQISDLFIDFVEKALLVDNVQSNSE